MKTMLEKLEKCKTCQNRKFRPDCGIVCGLTNEKPAFEDECSEYLANEDLVKQQEQIAEITNEENALDGKMPGANWFLWIAGLSVLNMGLSFIGWRFFFGLGTTEIFQQLTLWGLVPISIGVACILMLPAFFVWTWWATAKQGHKLFYKIGWGVFLIDTLIYLVLCGIFIYNTFAVDGITIYSIVILIIDIVLHVVVLSSGLKLRELKHVKSDNQPATMHKVCYIASALLVIAVAGYGLKSVISPSQSQIENAIVNSDAVEESLRVTNAQCPVEIDENTILNRAHKEGKKIILNYTLKGLSYSDYSAEQWDYVAAYGKSEALKMFASGVDVPEVVYLNNGYTMCYRYYDTRSNALYEVAITPEDYKAALANR